MEPNAALSFTIGNSQRASGTLLPMLQPLPHLRADESNWARLLDRTGICASIGCAVHCMIAPVLLIFAPVLGGMWTHPVSHLAIAALVLPIAAFALRRGFRHHNRRWVLGVGTVGMALVLFGAALPFWLATGEVHAAGTSDVHHAACHECCPSLAVDEATGAWSLRVPPASIITLLGGIGLVTAHFANLRCGAGCRG